VAVLRSEIQDVYFMMENRLFNELITIRKPVQLISESKSPVIEYQTTAVDIKARFEPLNTLFNRNVLGNTAKQTFRVFINSIEIKPNYEIIRQSDGMKFSVLEIKNFFEHHTELIIEAKTCSV